MQCPLYTGVQNIHPFVQRQRQICDGRVQVDSLINKLVQNVSARLIILHFISDCLKITDLVEYTASVI